MQLYIKLAWRNILRQKRRTFIVVLAMMLGIGLMMFYDGLMAGFNQAIYGNAIKVLGGNVQVHAAGYRGEVEEQPLLGLADDKLVVQQALALPQVVAAGRRIRTVGLASSPEGAFPVSIIGFEPQAEMAVNLTLKYLVDGRLPTADDGDQLFIGKGLADEMGVTVGERITLAGQSRNQQLRNRTFTIIGIFDLGMPDLEKQTVYMSLAEAQELYSIPNSSTEIAIYLQRIGQENAVITALNKSITGYEIESYETNFPELRNAVGNKNGIMTIFSFVLLLIAGIGVMNLLLMAVYERTREIGVLAALGLKPGQISRLFLVEGVMIGLIGLASGVAFGLVLNGILMQIGIDYSSYSDMASYMALITGKVYPTWGTEQLALRTVSVVVICVLSAYFPAYEASRNEPAESLHFV